MNNNYSHRTLAYIRREEEIKNTVYGRQNRDIKMKDLRANRIKLNLSKCTDTFFIPFKYPVTILLLCSTIGMGSYIVATNYSDAREDYNFFSSLEKDPTIPKETFYRVQKHYYNKNK